MSRLAGWWFRSDTGVTHGFRRSASLPIPLTAAIPDHARSRVLRLSFRPTLLFPSFLLFLLFFFVLFFFLVASYDVTLGQGPKAAPEAE